MFQQTVTARMTVWNHFFAFPITRLMHRLFGDRAFLWCVNNIFEGRIWMRSSTNELN